MVFWNTLFVLLAALLVTAQSATPTESGIVLPSSTAGLDPCMETCFEDAAAANSCPMSVTPCFPPCITDERFPKRDDVNCVCASAQLQADLTQCLDAECSPFAAPQAQGLLLQLCNKGSRSYCFILASRALTMKPVRIVATGSATPGHLSLSSAPTSTTGLPQIPVQNQENSAPSSMVVHAYLGTVVVAATVVGSLTWNWI